MRAGTLRHKVTLQERTETQDSTGAVTWSWSDVASVWASVEPLNGREYLQASQLQSTVSTRIRIRHREGITSKMRVKFIPNPRAPSEIKYYDIRAVVPVREANWEIVLMCEERATDG